MALLAFARSPGGDSVIALVVEPFRPNDNIIQR